MTTQQPLLGLILRSGGVMLALDLADGALPSIVHWGADPGPLDEEAFDALRQTAVLPVGASEVDVPVRIAILPEHARGWMGTPGVSGSRAGAAWSPLWRTTSALLDGRELLAPTAPRLVEQGSGALVVNAVDDAAELRLTLTVELSVAGVARLRAEVENTGDSPYQLDQVLDRKSVV